MQLHIDDIKMKMNGVLPGIDAQMPMAPPIRTKNTTIPENVNIGGVLVLLYMKENNWHTLLIRRTKDGNVHSGQISFPGGKKEESDITIINTALRECKEEIGIEEQMVQILGTLTPLYIPPSNFLVTATVAYATSLPSIYVAPKEVEYIIEVPLHILFDSNTKQKMQVTQSDNKNNILTVPCYSINNDTKIWGATAMLLSELETILKN